MDIGYLLIFLILGLIGLAALWGIAAIESRGAKGLLVVLLAVLVIVEKGIFELMIPAGVEEVVRQNNKCAVAYYSPGCPGYPPPWLRDP